MNAEDIRIIEQGARGIIEGEGHELVPMLFIIGADGQRHVTPMMGAKHQWPLFIRFLVGKLNASRYMFVDEIWMAKLPPDSPWAAEITSGRMRVSELPPDDRQEMVMISEQTRAGKLNTVMAPISVDRNGKRHLGKFEKMPGTARSRFSVSWNPTMKIQPVHYNMLREKIYEFLNAHPQVDHRLALSSQRARWDIYWASGGGFLSSGGTFGPYNYLDDNNIDTALRHILERYHRGADPRIIEMNPRYKVFMTAGLKPRSVEGFELRYPGEFAKYKFFITRHPGTYGLEADPRPKEKLKGKYVVTEITTGLSMLGAFDNPEEAAYKVGEKLKSVGVERFDEIMEIQRRSNRSLRRMNPGTLRKTIIKADAKYFLENGFIDRKTYDAVVAGRRPDLEVEWLASDRKYVDRTMAAVKKRWFWGGIAWNAMRGEVSDSLNDARSSLRGRNPLPNALTMRLAEKAMALHEGDVAGTVAWLKMLGATNIYMPEGEREAALTGPSGIRVGIIPSDPVTCAAQLGFAVAGTFWPQAFPGLMEEVNRRWKAQKDRSRIGGKRP